MSRQRIDEIAEFGTAFKTEFGYCSAVVDDKGVVLRFCLPTKKEKAEKFIGKIPRKRYPELEGIVQAYFRGEIVEMKDFKLPMARFPIFRREVYSALLRVKRGEVLTYGELARRAGHPGAARAVGTAMAKNPLPLLIPCHRVIRGDGTLGQFTADGGADFKMTMQELEKIN